MIDFSDSSEVGLLSSPADSISMPSLTYFEKVCSICGLSCSYVPALDCYFLNHWMFATSVPPFIICYILGAGAVPLLNHFLLIPLSLVELVYMSVTFVLFLWSYLAVILEGPGYLPFYFPARLESQTDYYLGGVVSSLSQLEFVKRNPPPPQTRYFQKARRLVLRADHFCHWVGCFIGHKNFKLFYLFNIWGVLFLFSLGPVCWRSVKSIWQNQSHSLLEWGLFVGNGIYLISAYTFLVYQSTFVFTETVNILADSRQFEQMIAPEVERPKWRPGRIRQSWRSVFGGWKQCPLWCLPIGTFHGVDEYALVKELEESLQ
jgi:hypothetical protein